MKELLVLCLLSHSVRADTDFELYNNDGWIPMTNMQVHNTRRSDGIPMHKKTQENTEYPNENDFIQIVTPDIRISKDFSPLQGDSMIERKRSRELFQDTKQDSFVTDCIDHGKGHYRYYFKIANNLEKPSHLYIVKLSGSSICSEREDVVLKEKHNFQPSDISRFDRSLKVAKEDVDIDKILSSTEDLENLGNSHETANNNSEPNIISEKTSYEVTEEAESTNANHGYVYQAPKSNTSNELNLTDKLFNILAKYNIRADDNLQNYDLSRADKDRNPATPDVLRPFDAKAHGYNSLNHLPVDPLLAVFLSHYGHYLPSAYGIRSNYNNAYGYLASNNIHNNKPFGMYKMFSDNDSRN